MTQLTVYTIGHGDRPVVQFLYLLEVYEVDMILDVRSAARRFNRKDYGKHALPVQLRQQGVGYDFLGREFGPVHESVSHLDEDGKVNFKKVQSSLAFNRVVARMRQLARQDQTLCLMSNPVCPTRCHRFSLICSYLVQAGWEVVHILGNGLPAAHQEMEGRLLEHYFREHVDRYKLSEEELLEKSYWNHNQDLGWTP